MKERPKARVLFVCGGNTCRSPMAEALASGDLGHWIHPQSAGVDVGEYAARRTAILVMREEFGLDISRHMPRDVQNVRLEDFDHVVAMKPRIALDLIHRFHVPSDKLTTWDVDDPAGGDRNEYPHAL